METVLICSDGSRRQMYLKNRIRPEVEQMILEKKYDSTMDYLDDQNCLDDYSFISLDVQQTGRKCA